MPRKRTVPPPPRRSPEAAAPAEARVDLSTALGPLKLTNPVMVASGTFGALMDTVLDVSKLGAVVEKTVTKKPRKGNPPPRVWETAGGMLNSIGLENYGLEGWIRKRYPQVKDYPCALIVSVSGETVEEYSELVRAIDALPRVDAFELNISCPNVSHGLDHATDPAAMERVVRLAKAATRRPVFAKLTPNVTDVVTVARAAMEGGADGLSLINTLKGMAIDWRRRAPCLGAGTGGLSGPAIKPVALRMVWEVCSALPAAPVMGIGGISNADDALEFIVAGARAVQVGTANFVEPRSAETVVDGMRRKLAEAGIARVTDVVGTVTKSFENIL
ncbi:MAG: dihydroorotate dehydrogenase [Planctomycetes bacterium]|nr:dihydroorotate dehydrogenase [Planctomycetota bacterium]